MDGYSIPGWAPLYPEGPYEYDGFTALIFQYSVEQEQLQRLVPDPLSIRRSVMSLAIYDYGVVNGFGSYHELATSIPVSYEGQPLSYAPYVLLDADAPFASGREVWGIPKKLGEVTLNTDGTLVTATGSRSDKTLLKATLDPHGSTDKHPLKPDSFETVFRKTIPAATEGAGPVVDRLVVAETREVTADRALTGPATIEATSSAADPLAAFVPTGAVTGYMVEGGWVLDRTENAVLHRYEEST